nr:hypothetical protein GCM10020092_037800 [Actinoplanes digitatis]
MPGDESLHRGPQPMRVDRARQHQRDLADVRVRRAVAAVVERVEEQAVLERCGRQDLTGRREAGLDRRPVLVVEHDQRAVDGLGGGLRCGGHPRERGHGLRGEHVAGAQDEPGLPGPAGQADRGDRVTAQLEEIIVSADLGRTEHLGEQPAQDHLPRCARRTVFTAAGECGRGQRPPVHLPGRGQRQPVEHHERRRNQIVRQQTRRVLPQTVHLADHVGDQTALSRQHHRLRHPRMGTQHGLDLTRLDPMTTDLHLLIGPADEHQLPRRRPPHQITGAIHPRTGRACHEP